MRPYVFDFSFCFPSCVKNMIPNSFLSIPTPLHKTTISPLISHTKIPKAKISRDSFISLSLFGFQKNNKPGHKETRLLLPLSASRGSSDRDNRAIETIFRLYEAIKEKNLNEISEIIGHDCQCVCSFVSMFKTFNGKKQVLEFFSSLMSNLGNKFEFVVQPTLHDGMTVGVSWKLECSKTHQPIGRGFSFYMCHVYQGEVLIRNVEMCLEPFSHIEPARLKMMGLVAGIIGHMASQAIHKGEKRKTAYAFWSIVILAMLFTVVKLYSC